MKYYILLSLNTCIKTELYQAPEIIYDEEQLEINGKTEQNKSWNSSCLFWIMNSREHIETVETKFYILFP